MTQRRAALARRLKARRHAAKVSLPDAADKLRVYGVVASRESVMAWERQKGANARLVPAYCLDALAAVYKCDLADFFRD